MIILLLAPGLGFFSPVLGATVFALMTFWLVLLPVLFYTLGKHSGRVIGQLRQELRQQALDYLQGMAEALIYGSEKQLLTQLRNKEHQLHDCQNHMAKLEGLGSALLILAAGSSVLVMLFMAAGEYQNRVISGPVLVMSVFTVLAGFEALIPVPAAFQFLGLTTLAARQLRQVTEAEPLQFGSVEKTIRGDIEFRDVCFSYENQQVLKNINFQVSAGDHIALLGRTGCGKSTLAGLLTRHNDCHTGQVMVDGDAIETYTEASLFGQIAVVPQKTHVLSASLRDNLKLAKPDASDQELIKVLNTTGLNSLAAAQGRQQLLDIWLGQGGASLSGGEQRRLAIARVLLKQAAIVILDEPSEGLDTVSEQQLLQAVVDACQGKTLVMITHKQALLERMDKIYRLDGGELCSM